MLRRYQPIATSIKSQTHKMVDKEEDQALSAEYGVNRYNQQFKSSVFIFMKKLGYTSQSVERKEQKSKPQNPVSPVQQDELDGYAQPLLVPQVSKTIERHEGTLVRLHTSGIVDTNGITEGDADDFRWQANFNARA